MVAVLGAAWVVTAFAQSGGPYGLYKSPPMG